LRRLNIYRPEEENRNLNDDKNLKMMKNKNNRVHKLLKVFIE
jgi:hypothetical protein